MRAVSARRGAPGIVRSVRCDAGAWAPPNQRDGSVVVAGIAVGVAIGVGVRVVHLGVEVEIGVVIPGGGGGDDGGGRLFGLFRLFFARVGRRRGARLGCVVFFDLLLDAE